MQKKWLGTAVTELLLVTEPFGYGAAKFGSMTRKGKGEILRVRSLTPPHQRMGLHWGQTTATATNEA